MDTAHLKAFLRIAETGSISRAAESLGVAQPSLSQQLLRLEDEVGAQLFDRTSRGVTLTDAGKVFQEGARQILFATETALAEARSLRDEARGQVVFAMPPSIAQLIGAELVEQLAQAAPACQVRVVEAFTGTIRGWIEAEKVDLGILYDLGPLRHLLTSPLASDELVAIGAPGRFAREGWGDKDWPAEVALADLADARWIAPGRQHGLRQVLDAEAARRGLALTVAREVDSVGTTVELVAKGHGVAVLPHCAVIEARFAGLVSVARLDGGGLWRRLMLARNPAHVLTHASVRIGHLTRAIMARLVADGSWPATIENG